MTESASETRSGTAARRFRLRGELYQLGDKVDLPAAQFREFEKIGLVKRAKRVAPLPKESVEAVSMSDSQAAPDSPAGN